MVWASAEELTAERRPVHIVAIGLGLPQTLIEEVALRLTQRGCSRLRRNLIPECVEERELLLDAQLRNFSTMASLPNMTRKLGSSAAEVQHRRRSSSRSIR